MVALLVCVLTFVALFIKGTPPDDRQRYARAGAEAARRAWRAMRPAPESEPFRSELRARLRWPIVTFAIVAANVVVFASMIFGSGSLDDARTLLGWGGSFGPRTTNGEWWRLVAAT